MPGASTSRDADLSTAGPAPAPAGRRRWLRVAVLLAGIVIPQCALYGPSLLGWKILLPLDLLALPNYYLPPDVPVSPPPPSDWALADLVTQEEVLRRFAVEQVRSGRLPLWNPYIYCGAPFVAANHTAVFSPYRALGYLWPGPRVLAWEQMLRAVVAGVGAFLLFRRELRAAFAAAAVGAWCFPLSGTFVLALGWGHAATVTWLPWVLLAVARAVRKPGAVSAAGVMLTTALTQVSGHAATGAQVLLAGAAFAAWRIVHQYGWGGLLSLAAARSVGTPTIGWVLGVMLAAPQVLPTAEYLRTSERIASRLHGAAETRPTGVSALAQFILPDFHGSSQRGSVYVGPSGNRIESAAAGYPGLLIALVAAPLGLIALKDPRRRGACLFWLGVAVVCLVPTLGVPGVSRVFALPPLGMLRNNRLVTVAGFAVLSLGVIGLDAMVRAAPAAGAEWFRRWTRPMLVLSVAVGLYFAYLAYDPPAVIASVVERAEDLPAVRGWFRRAFVFGAAMSALAAMVWVALGSWRWPTARAVPLVWGVGLLALAEMLATAWGDNPQSDPSLYYPPVPALTRVAASTPGRVWGVYCLPPNLAMVAGLRDVRGYDAVDPARPVRLVQILSDPSFGPSPAYAKTQWTVPRVDLPLLNAVGVRYLIGRGEPPQEVRVVYRAADYWVVENDAALPRAYVPRRAEVLNDEAERLRRLASPDFAPAEVVYVEAEGGIASGPFEADARIVSEEPTAVRIDVDARTPAIVVLTDQWYEGWVARVDGRPVPVLRANHAFRAVEVPAGRSTVEYRYEPRGFRIGVWLAAVAVVAQGAWLVAGWARASHFNPQGEKTKHG